jgi:hypothetical protein
MVVAGFITLLVVALVFLLFREALFRSGNILAPPTAVEILLPFPDILRVVLLYLEVVEIITMPLAPTETQHSTSTAAAVSAQVVVL